MKLLPVHEAQAHLDDVCQEALSGQIIRLQVASGAQLELKPVAAACPAPLGARELAACYDDAEWAAFENGCAKSSD